MAFLRRTPKSNSGGTQDPSAITPNLSGPRGASGRGHTRGFLDLEELNNELAGVNGLKLYDRMYRTDGDVRQVISMVTNPIVGGTWGMVAFGEEEATQEDEDIADEVEWALVTNMRPSLPGHLIEVCPVLFRSGFTPFEQIWGSFNYNGKVVIAPKSLQLRLPRTIQKWHENPDGTLRSIEQWLPVTRAGLSETELPGGGFRAVDGEPYKDNFVELNMGDLTYYRCGGEGDNWEGVSMLRPAYKHWKLKDAIERIDAVAQEREALGVPIAYPPMSATAGQLQELEDILTAMRANNQGYIIMPGPSAQFTKDGTGWHLDVLSNAKQGRDPMPSLNYHTDKIAAAFISEFMRIGHGAAGGSGARASAQIQQDPFLLAVEAIVGSLIEPVIQETLVDRYVAINHPEAYRQGRIPKIRMSLVDKSAINDLADYVSKLVQVKALNPDQVLENFLRERVDLPLPDPTAVKERVAQEQQDREMAMEQHKTEMQVALNPPANPVDGGSGKPGQKPNSAGSAPSGGKPSKPSGSTLDSIQLADGMDTEVTDRYHRRPHHAFMELEAIDSAIDGARDSIKSAVMPHVMAYARQCSTSMPKNPKPPQAMVDAVSGELQGLYEFGRRTVVRELNSQGGRQYSNDATAGVITLAKGDSQSSAIQRAIHAATHIVNRIRHAVGHSQFLGHDAARQQMEGEVAGAGAARQAAVEHASSTINEGRQVEAAAHHGDGHWVGVVYDNTLDGHSICGPCWDYANGPGAEVRALDDPVRLAHRPPNTECEGGLRCRCVEHYVSMPEGTALDVVNGEFIDLNWVQQAGGLPSYVHRIVAHLKTHFDESQAVATAINVVKKMCSTGDLNWPGLQHVNVGSQAEACAAVAHWERMKAAH